MPRTTTQNYYTGPTGVTNFAWADNDNDKFSREQDLYMLSQALELHDHDVTKGLPIARLGDSILHSGAYKPNSIPTSAYGDGTITGIKIAEQTIPDNKMVYPPLHKAGDVMTESLRVNRAASGIPDQGYVFLGSGQAYLHYSGSALEFNAPNDGYIYLIGYPNTRSINSPTTGYIYYGNGHSLGWNGTAFVVDGTYAIAHAGNSLSVPLGAMVCFRAASEIPAGGAWVRETSADGRILVGAGTTSGGSGISWAENQLFSTDANAWKLTGHLTITGGGGSGTSGTTLADSQPGHDFFAPGGTGNTHVSTTTHVHDFTVPGGGSAPTLNNTQQVVYPPMKSVVWARRVS